MTLLKHHPGPTISCGISRQIYADGLGLVISEKKTKHTLTGEHQLSTDVLINHNKAETVEKFTNLGSSINNQGIIDHELRCRVGKASAVFRKCGTKRILATKNKPRKQIDAFDTKCLRKMLGIHWSDHVTNKEVRIRSGQALASAATCRRRMSWLGHVSPTRPAQQALVDTSWSEKERKTENKLASVVGKFTYTRVRPSTATYSWSTKDGAT